MQDTAEQITYSFPFDDEVMENTDFIKVYEEISDRYLADEVEFDYSADKFVEDTQAIMSTAEFVGKFEMAQEIAMRMHLMCGQDHGLQLSVNANETFSESLNGYLGEQGHQDHNHGSENKPSSKSEKELLKKKKRDAEKAKLEDQRKKRRLTERNLREREAHVRQRRAIKLGHHAIRSR